MPRRKNKLAGTVHAWSDALGCNEATITQGLTRAGVTWESGEEISARIIFQLFTGDKQQSKIRLDTAMAEKIERENKVAEKELCELATVEKLVWEGILLPLRQALEAAPASLSVQCNPADPSLAQTVLGNWVEEIKKQIREK